MARKQPRKQRIRRPNPVGLRLATDVRRLLPIIAQAEERTMAAVVNVLVRERAKALGIAA